MSAANELSTLPIAKKRSTKIDLHKGLGHRIAYYVMYDTFYCVDCNEWLEGNCGCPQCEKRPLRPLETVGVTYD